MRKISLLLFMCLGCMSTYADNVSRQEAQQIASRFFATQGAMLTTTNVATYSLLDNAAEEYAPYYVFNAAEDKGFVIVSGNSLTEEILGYSDTGTFDEATIPDNMREWLQCYSDEINWVAAHESTILAARATAVQTYATAVRHAIAPLLTCTWGQGDPYNYLCPTYTSSGETGTSAVGCVATAMAQVMYFHKYPAAVVADIPARSSYKLPAVPAGTKLDWDNMLDSYECDYTDAQRQAVAELSLYAGQAVSMSYGASSSATTSTARTALKNYFGYADGIVYASASSYTIDEWYDLIYSEIEEGYPIMFRANATESSGHAFVLDGFNGDGFFHVNWGWSGGSDGYFRLTSLYSGDDTCSDINWAEGYTRSQAALLYVRRGDADAAQPKGPTAHVGTVWPYPTSDVLSFDLVNLTSETNTYEYTAFLRDEAGEYVPVTDEISSVSISTNTTKRCSVSLAGCFSEPGEYKLSPAYRLVGEEEWTILWTLDGDDYVLATVDDDLAVTITIHNAASDIRVTNWDYTGYMILAQEQHVVVTLVNTGAEYNAEMYLYAYRPGDTSIGAIRSRAYVGVKSGGETKVDFYFTPDAVGEWILDVYGTQSVGTDTVDVVTDRNASTANLSVPSITISNDCYGSRLTGTATIKNNAEEEDFNGRIRIYLWTSSGGGASSPGSTTLNVDGLAPGRTQALAFNFSGLNIGQGYSISVRDKATEKDIEDGGALDWSMPYVLKAGILQWSNDGTISGSANKDALSPATSVASIFCEEVSPTTITPSKNTNTIFAFTAGTTVPDGLEGYNVVYGNEAEQITFANNGYAAYLPLTFTAHEVVYSHTFAMVSDDGQKGWEPLLLPFKPDGVRCDGGDIAWRHGADDEEGMFYLREFSYEDDSQTVVFEDVEDISTLWANAPYVIAATPQMAGKTVEFYAADARLSETGTVPYIACTDDYYFYGTTLRVRDSGLYVLNNEGSAYEYKSGTTSVSPFENYFITTLPEDQRPEMIYISTEAATGIRAIESAATPREGVYYDLLGRRIPAPTKGVYILNGKKYVK